MPESVHAILKAHKIPTEPKQYVTAYVPKDVKDKIDFLAHENEMSASTAVKTIILWYIKMHESKYGPLKAPENT